MTSPSEAGFYMPAEWTEHSRCWMEWPCRAELWGDHLDAARDAYAQVAKAVSDFEPVTMIANPESVAEVSLRCGSGIGTMPLPHDDSWMRDNGPTFVVDGEGAVAGVDWKFNGWGKYEPYDKDAEVARLVLERLKMRRFEAPFVLEGGAIHVDGEGTLLTTEQCLLNPNRNPDLTRKDIERLLASYLGIQTVIWLGEGLQDDDTDGHVDQLACFIKPGAVLALTSSDPQDGNYKALQDNLERLRTATDAKGRELEIIEIEQPKARKTDKGRRLACSYINFYIANGGIVMPSFEDSRDDAAYDIIVKCFPDRNVVQIPALEIVYGGGGIHCITQQQPTGKPAP